MDADTLARAAGINADCAAVWAAALTAAMSKFSISTPLRQAAFIAQVGHESAGFTALSEDLNYSAHGLARTWPARYAQKDGTPNARAKALHREPELIANDTYAGRLGNVEPGDGWAYRGRGLIQLTGRDNYRAAGTDLGLPLEAEPDRVLEPAVAAMTAAWFWRTRNLNALADAGKTEAITRKVNGGLHGLADRHERYARALQVLA